MLRTAPDLAPILAKNTSKERKLSNTALEILAIIAYNQPVTRAKIENIRGVSTSKGNLDVIIETGGVRPRSRKRALGRPLIYSTSTLTACLIFQTLPN